MLNDQTIEQRLTYLEQAVADLKDQMAAARVGGNWLEKVTGSISDEAAFLEALEYGRAFRNADRPPEGDSGEDS